MTTRTMQRMVWMACCGALLSTVRPAHAEPTPPPAPAEAPSAPPALAPVTRGDLAHLYLRLERALKQHPPAADRTAAVNRAFDAASLKFFSGQFGPVVREINELRLSIESDAPATPAELRGASMKIDLDPPVLALSNGGRGRVRVAAMYAAEPAEGVRLRVSDAQGRELISRLINDVPDTIELDVEKLGARAGQTLLAEIRVGTRVMFDRPWPVVAAPLAGTRDALLSRLKAVQTPSPELEQAHSAAMSRVNLLTDTPSDTNSAEFLADPVALLTELDAEVAALERGVDPYRRRTGDLWRTVQHSGLDLPIRIFAPAAASDDTPRPLIIALHGAGGDESMFFDGYGAGLIKELAESRGFIVVAPLTTMMMGNPKLLDATIDAIAMTHAIDRQRVSVLGHSLGAGAAAGLATARAETLASAACLAGFARFRAGASIPPTLIVAGELDPLAPASRARPAADAAIAAGLPIEFRALPEQGHTLMVAAALPDVVDWLLSKRRAK